MKRHNFSRFPVAILPDGAEEYTPGHPLPEGAYINQPLPAWVLAIPFVAVVALMLVFSGAGGNSDAVAVAAPSQIEQRAANDSVISYKIMTFTPVPLTPTPMPELSTPEPHEPVMSVSQPIADDQNIRIVVSPMSGAVGVPINVVIQDAPSNSRLTVYLNDRPVSMAVGDRVTFLVPQSQPGVVHPLLTIESEVGLSVHTLNLEVLP